MTQLNGLTQNNLMHVRALNRTPTIIFDVGVNVGQFTRLVLSMFSNVKVYGFEPNIAFHRLYKFPACVEISSLAMSDEEEEATLFIPIIGREIEDLERGVETTGCYSPDGGIYGASTINHNRLRQIELEAQSTLQLNSIQERPCQTTRLDAYCKRHSIERIDYLKVDTEGHDSQVLLGASGLLAQQAIIAGQIEYSEAQMGWQDMLQYMSDYGYQLYDDFRQPPLTETTKPKTSDLFFKLK